ncbi:hypothetical protein A4A49_58136 [Nicotiana attenuata]|uniref:S-protein homolog n=1 Tax=Nicotiana attenuata TaxID=49451 RepID=A0A314L813_NICAT|nr:hypothetical protein A4A49_58136 [Nicotiana attenuata]
MKGAAVIVTITSTTTIMTMLLFFLIDVSTVAAGFPDTKTVVVTNNHTNYLSIRCFSFDDDGEVRHLNKMGSFNISVEIRKFFPSSTMYNCSTNMGTFVAFRSDYECISHSTPCEWRFDEEFTYLYNPKDEEWVIHEYNPNYESLKRGGVIKGYYVN